MRPVLLPAPSCVARLPARQRSCLCTVVVTLRQSVAPSACSCRCDAPVFWRRLTVSAIFACSLSLSNSSEEFDTPYSTVLLQTLLRVGDSLHFDTLLLNLMYGYFDQCWALTHLLNTLGLLIDFLSNLRAWHDNSLHLGILHTFHPCE